jgi:hypothetical protein
LTGGEGVTVAMLDTGIVAGASLPDWLAESLQPVGPDDTESPDAGPAAGRRRTTRIAMCVLRLNSSSRGG